jgi:hypothetical protein
LRMRAVWLIGAVGMCVACGGGYAGDRAKTPEEIVQEEERLAEEDQRDRDAYGDVEDGGEELEVDKKAKFDVRQSEMELKRASRSAATCPGTVEEKAPTESVVVTLTFANTGNVKGASLDEQYADTKIGQCVLRAMKAVIVPKYTGAEVEVPWKVEFVDASEGGK